MKSRSFRDSFRPTADLLGESRPELHTPNGVVFLRHRHCRHENKKLARRRAQRLSESLPRPAQPRRAPGNRKPESHLNHPAAAPTAIAANPFFVLLRDSIFNHCPPGLGRRRPPAGSRIPAPWFAFAPWPQKFRAACTAGATTCRTELPPPASAPQSPCARRR